MTLKPLPHPAFNPDAGKMADEFDECFKSVETAVRGIVGDFQKAAKNVYDARFVLGPLMYWVRKDLDRAWHGIETILQLAKTAFERHLPVVSLIYQSFSWLHQVKAPMTSLAGTTEEKRIMLRNWTGTAREIYDEKRAGQVAAMADVGAKAQFISNWLMTLAINNVHFMTEMMKQVIDFAARFVAAAVKTETVVGIPEAAGDLGDIAADAAKKTVGALAAVAEKFVAALGDAQTITSQVTEQRLFIGGQWPQAVENH